MGYKQIDNPFTELDNSFTNPKKINKRQVRKQEALKWNMPDLNSIVEKKADGSTVTEDQKTEKTTGTDKEGAVPKAQEGQDGTNANLIHRIDQDDAREKQSQEARSWKGEKKGRKKHERQNRRDIKRYTKGINRGEVDKDDEGYQEALARQGYYDKRDTKGKDWHAVEDDFQVDYQQKLKAAADAKAIDEMIYDDNIESHKWYQDDQKAEDERVQAEMTERLNRFKKEDDLAEANKQQANAYGRGKGQAPGMYNNTTNMKQVNSKGNAFPMVAQQPQTNPYGQEEQAPNRAGRSPESNQLSNDPNINQPLNKVPNSTFETNQKFSDIASSAGDPYDQPQAMENVAGNTPAYGQPAYERTKKSSGTTKRGAEVSLTTRKAVDGEETDSALDHTTMGRINVFNRPTPDTPNTVTYSKTNKKGKTKTKTALGGTGKSKRLSKKYAKQVDKGTRNKAEYDGVASFKGLVSKLESEGKSKESATKIAGAVANAKMKGAGSGPTAAQKARSKGASMEKHTKVTKSNYKSAEKDDAAHASYLKRDVKDIQKSDMSQQKKDAYETADEKHISKLYGDLKYDHGHHGRKYDNV